MKPDLTSFEPFEFERYAPGDDDISFDIHFCGMCHTDVHFVQNALGLPPDVFYPMVPGHELAGVVTGIGKNVKSFKIGDKIGVGCMVDSCLECSSCGEGYEQYCATGSTFTYGGMTTYGRSGEKGKPTRGGYSNKMVVHEKFAIKIPDSCTDLAKAAPLLCAGITMYEPLYEHNCLKGGKTVGIVGLGGLGGMGIKLAAKMGCKVIAFSTSPSKEVQAKEAGAETFVLTSDPKQLEAVKGTCDVILDTVSAGHELVPYLDALKTHGKHVLLGLADKPYEVPATAVLFGHKSVTASLIGGIKRTQEMMDFCCAKDVFPTVDIIKQEQIMGALKKLDEKNDQIKRFVVDCSTLG